MMNLLFSIYKYILNIPFKCYISIINSFNTSKIMNKIDRWCII